MEPAAAAAVTKFMDGKAIGIKKLLAVVDMARDHDAPPDAPVTEEAFMEALSEWGL